MPVVFPWTFRDGVRQVISGDQVMDNLNALKALVDSLEAQFPPGVMMVYVGRSAPSGWLLADGSPVTTSNANLRNMLIAAGSPFGTSGSDPKLPDLRGRAPIGAGTGSGMTARTLGDSFGAETHVLTINELARHAHNPPTSGDSYLATRNAGNAGASAGSGVPSVNFAASTPSAGGDAAHNNMQPSLVVNYIVKT